MTAYTAKTINDFQHERLKVAKFAFKYSDAIAAGSNFVPCIQLPPGAVAIGGALIVTTAFNTGTTATVSVGTSGSPTSVLAATSVKAAATTAATLPGTSTSAQTFGVTFAQVGTAPTAGAGIVYLSYLLPYGSDFSVGNDAEVNL